MRADSIIISGFGGQGVVAAGKTIAHAGLLDRKIVSMLPAYGPEMRGGFANCNVIISDTDIASPIVSMADVVIAMSLPALEKFESRVKPGKTLIIDSYQIKKTNFRNDINIIEIPAIKLAMDVGSVKFANVVMIGALMAVLSSPTVSSMTEAIKELLPKEKESLIPLEMDALYLGMNYRK
jgi:2-oxoglutarate ferredoxin oxidoreductase subunit gamma